MSNDTAPPKKDYTKYPTGPVECPHPGCDRSFQNEDGLRIHKIRIHDGVKWSNKGKKRGSKKKTKINKIKPAKSAKQDSADIPYAKRSGGEIPCDECDRTFKSEAGVIIHKARAHSYKGRLKKAHKRMDATVHSGASSALALTTTRKPAPVVPGIPTVRVQRMNGHLPQPPPAPAEIYFCPSCGGFLNPHFPRNFCGGCGYPVSVIGEAAELVSATGH